MKVKVKMTIMMTMMKYQCTPNCDAIQAQAYQKKTDRVHRTHALYNQERQKVKNKRDHKGVESKE